MVYLIYRCDCGHVLYSKDTTKTKKCSCGKTLNVKKRRILKKVDTIDNAIYEVQNMQEELYGGLSFCSADNLLR